MIGNPHVADARPGPVRRFERFQDDIHTNIRRRDIGIISLSTLLASRWGVAPPAKADVVQPPREGFLTSQQTDLIFPREFEGTWNVTSVLTKVDLPFGEAQVPDVAQVRRAEAEDLDKPKEYQVRFVTTGSGWTIMDRKYNTASLLETYTGMDISEALQRIQWNPSKPDHMSISLPRGLRITSDINQRTQKLLSEDLLETSEFYQQFIDDSQKVKLKASRAYTKWRWRQPSQITTGGDVAIVATQLVADFADPNDRSMSLESLGKPIVVYTYRLSLRPHVV